MNKNAIKKMMIAAIACIALCGTTLAAPAHKPAQGRAPAPQVQKAHRPAPAPQAALKPAPRVAAPDGRPAVGGYPAPHKAPVAKPMPKPMPQHHVVHHKTPQHKMPPRRPATPCHRHHRHECHDCHYNHDGWVELGAGIIGGIIGALIAG